MTPENQLSVEEAFAETRVAIQGMNFKAGRFLSSIGYLNNQHAHTWDFVDAPLAYQAFLGGQYKADGVQSRYLLPTDQFIELGAEIGNGAAFPGTARNKNGVGSTALFATWEMISAKVPAGVPVYHYCIQEPSTAVILTALMRQALPILLAENQIP